MHGAQQIGHLTTLGFTCVVEPVAHLIEPVDHVEHVRGAHLLVGLCPALARELRCLDRPIQLRLDLCQLSRYFDRVSEDGGGGRTMTTTRQYHEGTPPGYMEITHIIRQGKLIAGVKAWSKTAVLGQATVQRQDMQCVRGEHWPQHHRCRILRVGRCLLCLLTQLPLPSDTLRQQRHLALHGQVGRKVPLDELQQLFEKRGVGLESKGPNIIHMKYVRQRLGQLVGVKNSESILPHTEY